MSKSYLDIKAYIKQINTTKGLEELHSSENPPAWVFWTSKVQQPAAEIMFNSHTHVSQTNCQNRNCTLTHLTDACSSQKISLYREQSSGASDTSSSAYVLYENKSETSEHALSAKTPIVPPHQHAGTLKAKIETGYESDAPAIPHCSGALITLPERRKLMQIYRPTNRR